MHATDVQKDHVNGLGSQDEGCFPMSQMDKDHMGTWDALATANS